MKRPTIRDVAKRADVGIGTVSRVINNNEQVKAETRAQVLKAIQELGFKPNYAARSLPRKTQFHNIGVITQPFVNYHSFAERLRGVQQALGATENKYELVLYNVSSLEHFNKRIASIIQTHSVEGLLVVDLELSEAQQEALNQANIPFVGIGCFGDVSWPFVGTDDIEGGYLATRHLIDFGHSRIMYVGDTFFDDYGFSTSKERYQGYIHALEEQGIAIQDAYVHLGSYGYDNAKTLTLRGLEQAQPPTAIFAMSDVQALGCIAAVGEYGLKVPGDISVIGYDDLEFAHHCGLTTVRQHLELSGHLSVKYLLELLSRQDAEPPMLPPLKVIPRQTTKPLPGTVV